MNTRLADAELGAELERWRASGMRPRLFLRDDDAVDDTPALRRLFAACERAGAPLLLAAIPALATPALGRVAMDHPLVMPAVHGYAHASHSPRGEKPCEIGRHRAPETVLSELAAGRNRLLDLCAGTISGLLVPPWNRIHDELVGRIGEAGFAGISAHGWERRAGARFVNAHIDIVHWSAGGAGRTGEWLLGELARNLGAARALGGRAVGILTHHRAHDETAWAGLDLIFSIFAGEARWVAADDLLARAQE
jgi:hypothetical protein